MASEATPLAIPLQLRKRQLRRDVLVSPAVQAHLALASLATICVLIVLAAAGSPSFLSAPARANYYPGWLAGPFGGIWPQAAGEGTLKWLFSGGVVAAYGCYVVLLRRHHHLSPRLVVAAVAALQLLFLLGPPLALTDVFNYFNYARMEVVHHLNPYVTMPLLEPHTDPAFPLSNWHGLLSPYGPLFTIFTFLFAPLSAAAYLWTYKAALLAADAGLLALTWAATRWRGGCGREALIWVGLNPIVLIWGLGADHNDFFTMVLVMGGCYLLVVAGGGAGPDAVKRPLPPALAAAAGGFLIAISAFFKASAGVILPLALLAARSQRRQLAGAAVGGAVGLAVGLAATLVAFGPHFPDLAVQDRLVTALSIPNLTGLALGQGGETQLLHGLFQVGLGVALLACCRLAWRTGSFVEAGGWASFAVIATLSWVLPWYVIWVLPFCALSSSPRLRKATLWLGLYLILSWLPVTSQVLATVGFHPQQTAVGREHARAVAELLTP